MDKRMKILNSTFEMALRFLAIMSVCGYSFSEQRLRAYSYFAIHLSDLDNTKMSAHPNLPFRFNNYIGTEKNIASCYSSPYYKRNAYMQ